MNGAVTPIRGKEFGEGAAEVVSDKWRNDIFVTQRDDKKVVSTGGVEVVVPARTRVRARLGVNGRWRLILFVFHQRCNCCVLVGDLSVQDHG